MILEVHVIFGMPKAKRGEMSFVKQQPSPAPGGWGFLPQGNGPSTVSGAPREPPSDFPLLCVGLGPRRVPEGPVSSTHCFFHLAGSRTVYPELAGKAILSPTR